VNGGRGGSILLRLATAGVLLFMYFPLALVIAYAFNANGTSAWPPSGFSLEWVQTAIANTGLRDAFVTSLAAALGATLIAVILGTLASLAVARYGFLGREAISFVIILPLALPGIVTGMALSTTFATLSLPLGMFAIVVGHATFCIVLVYNNVIARLRRAAPSLEEASADLGADSWQTFRYITLPMVSTSLIGGALLAFALSFDQVVVTVFTAGAQNTLPLWIFGAIRLGQQLPEVNVVVSTVIVLTIIPVAIAARLTGGGGMTRAGAGRETSAEQAVGVTAE
jgi:putative spermidine/putrescine transport system permease protein